MKQYGVVLVFRPGTSKSDIERRLLMLRNILDSTNFVPSSVTGDGPAIHQFDREREGSPVWYIP